MELLKTSLVAGMVLIVAGFFVNLMAIGQQASGIGGRVVDSFGSPLARVEVEISAEQDGLRFATLTDDKGGFAMGSVPPGRYKVTVSLKGFVTERRRINIENGLSLELNFGLLVGHPGGQRPIELSGTVLGRRKRPLANATVTVASAFNDHLTYTTKTDRKGRYRADIYYPGRYTVRASKPGFLDTSRSIVLLGKVPSQRKKVHLVMVPAPEGN